MDHHEQHAQHHHHARDEKKHHHHEHEAKSDKSLRKIHPLWFLALGTILILAIVAFWTLL